MKREDCKVSVWYSAEDNCYIAKVMNLDGVIAHGDTPFSAINELKTAFELYRETLAKEESKADLLLPVSTHSQKE